MSWVFVKSKMESVTRHNVVPKKVFRFHRIPVSDERALKGLFKNRCIIHVAVKYGVLVV